MVTSQPKNETNDNATRISVYCPAGFHHDPAIMRLVDEVAEHCNQFVESGTEAGSTVGYTARMYPHLDCYSAETDEGTHNLARHNIGDRENVALVNMHSLDFLRELQPEGKGLFWLDAHSHGWGCDLGEEVDIVLKKWESGYIFLDDFEVPDREDFGFDWYESYGKLNWETIVKDITPEALSRINGLFYPNYEPPYGTRGFLLIWFGDCPYFDIEGLKEEWFEMYSLK